MEAKLTLMQRGSGIMKLVNGRSENGCRIVELSSGIEDGWSYAEIALILAAVSLEAAVCNEKPISIVFSPISPSACYTPVLAVSHYRIPKREEKFVSLSFRTGLVTE
jgi:hypothetical protein